MARKASTRSPTNPVVTGRVTSQICLIRGEKVLLDSDKEQVRRNIGRFPDDFMFQLTAAELSALRSQDATLKSGRGKHRKYLPYAFTEHGAIMVASVLNSPRAIEVGIYVVRAFVQLRTLRKLSKACQARRSAISL